MALFIDHFEVELIGGRIVTATKLDAFARTTLHLGGPRVVTDDKILVAGTQAHQAPSHILAHTTWAWFAEGCHKTNMRKIGSQLFSTHDDTTYIAHNTAKDSSFVLLDHTNGLIKAAMHRIGRIGCAGQRVDNGRPNNSSVVTRAQEANMRYRSKGEKVNDGVALGNADDATQSSQLLEGGEVVVSGIKEGRRHAYGRTRSITYIPENALLGKELRQSRQTKSSRVLHIILFGSDGQFMHISNGLKLTWGEFQTTEDLLIIRMALKTKGYLMTETLILESAYFFLATIEEIALR